MARLVKSVKQPDAPAVQTLIAWGLPLDQSARPSKRGRVRFVVEDKGRIDRSPTAEPRASRQSSARMCVSCGVSEATFGSKCDSCAEARD